MKRALCELLVLSHFNFGDFIYDPCLVQADKKRIQKVQNSCCRLIYGIRKYEHISHKIKECNWLNMENRRILHLNTFTHKLITNITSSESLISKFTPRSKVHSVNIRGKAAITMPHHRTSSFQGCYVFNAIRSYNQLPEEFKLYSINKFKYKLKDHLINRQ